MKERLLKKYRRALEVTTQIPILEENWDLLKRKVIFWDKVIDFSADKGRLIAKLKREHDVASFLQNASNKKDTVIYTIQNGKLFEYGDFDVTQESIFVFFDKKENTGEIYLYQP